MAKTTTKPFDAADYLKTEDDMVAYLEAALEEDDPRVVAAALGDIARAKGMTQVARDAGLGRESLYKALSANGNPELGTVMKVVRALGLSLHVRPCACDALTNNGFQQSPLRGAAEAKHASTITQCFTGRNRKSLIELTVPSGRSSIRVPLEGSTHVSTHADIPAAPKAH